MLALVKLLNYQDAILSTQMMMGLDD